MEQAAAPKKATWKGALTFSMVAIQIKMYLAADDESNTGLKLLCKKHEVLVKSPRRCSFDDAVLEPIDIVKGLPVGGEQFVVFTEDDLDSLPLHTMKSIDIEQFVPQAQVPVLTHARGVYYLEPERESAVAYALLREALRKSKKYGVGRFAFREREVLGIIYAQDNCLMLTTLCWPSAIRTTKQLALPTQQPDKNNLRIALTLIDHLSADWEPESYVDGYKQAFDQLVEDKLAGKKTTAKPKPTKTPPDLQAALRASMAKTAGRKAKKPAA
jgi:DNA end-binding protein Ku